MSVPLEAKRRKVRKGTHSCWECKRRKMRCIVDPHAGTGRCVACRRRGSQCISQEYPEEEGLTSSNPGKTPGLLTPASELSYPGPLAFYQHSASRKVDNGVASHVPSSSLGEKYERLSRFLHGSLPSQQTMDCICEASLRHSSVLAHEFLSMPYTALDQSGLRTPQSLLRNVPEPTLHPVLLARYMLQLVIFLQHSSLDQTTKGLPESSQTIMTRLTDMAVRLVTTNEEFHGSIECLECVMLESMYQTNIGSLRRSWAANRRAIGIGQLMGIHRTSSGAQFQVLDPNTRCHPQLMWFRIISLDRQLSLLLGLPEACPNHTLPSDALLAHETSMGRLERVESVLTSRLLARNAVLHSKPQDARQETQILDRELQRAARSLPNKWWLIPNLDPTAVTDCQTLFWDTRRLFAQILHYNLVNQLHLPYMLRSSPSHSEYSCLTCVTASREILSRFVTLRRFNIIAYSCRTMDFLALMAAMTLLLAHLDANRQPPAAGAVNFLAHQYSSDRALIEQAQENMSEVNRHSADALSAKSADLLRRLLAMGLDVDTPAAPPEGGDVPENPATLVVLQIPYFGMVQIASEGIRKVSSSSSLLQGQPSTPSDSRTLSTTNTTATPNTPNTAYLGSSTGFYDPLDAQVNLLSDALLQESEYPAMTAGADDWTFQGVDMAFFDCLMRSTGNEDATAGVWG